MHVKSVHFLLKKTLLNKPEFTQLKESLFQTKAISKVINNVLPEFLKKKIEIIILSKKILIIFALNNSIATRLRYIAPEIIQQLKKQGWIITQIKVQISRTQLYSNRLIKKSSLTAKALQHIEELMHTQEESILKHALQNLLKRHNKH